MQRFRVGSVDVDTCMDHGTWYDRGELGVVRDALRAGQGAASYEVAASKGGDGAASESGLELAHAPTHRQPAAPSRGQQQFGHAFDPERRREVDRMAKNEQRMLRRQPYDQRELVREERHLQRDIADGNVAGAALDVLEILLNPTPR
jgi:hypothetical protein